MDDSDYANPISLFQILLYIFMIWAALIISYLCNSWVAHRRNVQLLDAAEATCAPSVRRNAQERKNCTEPVKLSTDDVKTMIELEALDGGDNVGLRAAEFVGLFDEELRLGEVEEAFDLFDENGDGFIDAHDLKKVLCGLGFGVASQADQCRRMISAYDHDGDGRLSFEDFAKLLLRSFD